MLLVRQFCSAIAWYVLFARLPPVKEKIHNYFRPFCYNRIRIGNVSFNFTNRIRRETNPKVQGQGSWFGSKRKKFHHWPQLICRENWARKFLKVLLPFLSLFTACRPLLIIFLDKQKFRSIICVKYGKEMVKNKLGWPSRLDLLWNKRRDNSLDLKARSRQSPPTNRGEPCGFILLYPHQRKR